MAITSKETTRTLCIDECVAAIESVDTKINTLLAEAVHANVLLPDAFTVDDDRWIAARDAMEEAAGREDLNACIAACDKYKTRADRFLTGWRAKLGLDQQRRAA